MSSHANRTHTFHALDGFRGLAAIAVVLFHLAGSNPSIAPSGAMAPDLFFVLSGFVISYAYSERLQNGMPFGAFVKARAIRLYPLYFVGVTIALFALAISPAGFELAELALIGARSYLFIPGGHLGNLHAGNLYPLNPPTWSLLYEIGINATYALFIRRLNWKSVSTIAVVSGLGLLLIAVGHGTIISGWNLTFGSILIGTLRVTFSFSVGWLLYTARYRLPSIKLPVTFLLFLSVFPFLYAPPESTRLLYEIVCVFVVFPVLVILGSQAVATRRLAIICEWLGKTSYGIYIIHVPLISFATMMAPRSGLISDLTFTAVALLVVWAIDKWVDRPFRRWLTVRFEKNAPPLRRDELLV